MGTEIYVWEGKELLRCTDSSNLILLRGPRKSDSSMQGFLCRDLTSAQAVSLGKTLHRESEQATERFLKVRCIPNTRQHFKSTGHKLLFFFSFKKQFT